MYILLSASASAIVSWTENQTIEKQFRRVGEQQLLLLQRGTARVERLPKSQLIFEKSGESRVEWRPATRLLPALYC